MRIQWRSELDIKLRQTNRIVLGPMFSPYLAITFRRFIDIFRQHSRPILVDKVETF